MKLNILLFILFIIFITYGSVEYSHGIVGLTKLNGDGCVCHNITPDQSISVWIEGPDSVQMNQTAVYRVYLTGGPEAAGGFNVASRTGVLMPGDSTSQKIDLELTHTVPKLFSGDTLFWQFTYTAPSSALWDTIYSVAQSANLDGIPNSLDKWNFGANFPVKVVPFVPVELISFTANIEENSINLYWSTGSETNNSGFNIERKTSDEWTPVGFVSGHGTTSETNNYTYTDGLSELENVPKVIYRLKQIDYDGKFSYSNVVEINIELLVNFELLQNYPNPFNPSTKIKYSVPEETHINLTVYNILGQEVVKLKNDVQKPGYYEVTFDASSLSSGIYLYTLETAKFTSTKKMLLMK